MVQAGALQGAGGHAIVTEQDAVDVRRAAKVTPLDGLLAAFRYSAISSRTALVRAMRTGSSRLVPAVSAGRPGYRSPDSRAASGAHGNPGRMTLTGPHDRDRPLERPLPGPLRGTRAPAS